MCADSPCSAYPQHLPPGLSPLPGPSGSAAGVGRVWGCQKKCPQAGHRGWLRGTALPSSCLAPAPRSQWRRQQCLTQEEKQRDRRSLASPCTQEPEKSGCERLAPAGPRAASLCKPAPAPRSSLSFSYRKLHGFTHTQAVSHANLSPAAGSVSPSLQELFAAAWSPAGRAG